MPTIFHIATREDLFPHLYGPIDLDAVTEILPMIHGDGGAFADLVPVG